MTKLMVQAFDPAIAQLPYRNGTLVDFVPIAPVPWSKRIFDHVAAASLLLFFSPFFAVIAVLIFAREGGPVVFAHRRIGRGGKEFNCLKFRTMVRDSDRVLEELLARDSTARAEWDATFKLADDPRIMRLGRLLRKTSLDELPQLWNVLRGEMSMVGPRPIVAEERHFYKEFIADYASVLPGLTGAWQVGGRSATTYDERVAMDVDYVRNRSFFGDLKIVFKTIVVVLRRDGAC